MITLTFPVIFTKTDDGRTSFYCPYLEEVKGTYGADIAYKKASVMVRLVVQDRYDRAPGSLKIVSNEEIMDLKVDDPTAKILLIEASPKVKYARKTITIPYALNIQVKDGGINLSQFVRDALSKLFNKKDKTKEGES